MLVVPSYSQNIIHEMLSISSYMGTIGILNILVLVWSVTPLVADMRISIGTISRKKPSRPYLLEKLLDVVISIVFLVGLSAVTVLGVVFTLAEEEPSVCTPEIHRRSRALFLHYYRSLFALSCIFFESADLPSAYGFPGHFVSLVHHDAGLSSLHHV